MTWQAKAESQGAPQSGAGVLSCLYSQGLSPVGFKTPRRGAFGTWIALGSCITLEGCGRLRIVLGIRQPESVETRSRMLRKEPVQRTESQAAAFTASKAQGLQVSSDFLELPGANLHLSFRVVVITFCRAGTGRGHSSARTSGPSLMKSTKAMAGCERRAHGRCAAPGERPPNPKPYFVRWCDTHLL